MIYLCCRVLQGPAGLGAELHRLSPDLVRFTRRRGEGSSVEVGPDASGRRKVEGRQVLLRPFKGLRVCEIGRGSAIGRGGCDSRPVCGVTVRFIPVGLALNVFIRLSLGFGLETLLLPMCGLVPAGALRSPLSLQARIPCPNGGRSLCWGYGPVGVLLDWLLPSCSPLASGASEPGE